MANVPAHATILSSRAQKEITEAWNWYEDRQPGIGDRFLRDVRVRIEKIEQSPERYPTRFRSYKETPVPVFPFLIIYRINKGKNSLELFQYFTLL